MKVLSLEQRALRPLPDLNMNSQEKAQAAEWTAQMREQFGHGRNDDEYRVATVEETQEGNRT